MQGRKFARQLNDVGVAGQSVEQDLAGGLRVLGAGRFLAGISPR